MIRQWLIVLMFLFFSAAAFAQEKKPNAKAFRTWKEYMLGTGGSVGSLWTFGSGAEYAFFRDDYNHEVSVSLDLLNDRTTYQGQKLLAPVLVNYSWYGGPDPQQGFFVSAGAGLAIPLGLDHGNGSFGWQGSLGYVFSKRFTFGLRYIGRQAQTFRNAGTSFSVNNNFFGGTVSISF